MVSIRIELIFDIEWLSGEKVIRVGLLKNVPMVRETSILLSLLMSSLATNPNNWHWKEKNATQWSRDKLNDLLVGLKIENEEYSCEIKELKKCSGEASANNRKAKLVFLVNPYSSVHFFSIN